MIPAVGKGRVAVKADWFQPLPREAGHCLDVAEPVNDFFGYWFVKVGRDKLVNDLWGQRHFCVESAPRVGE